MAKKAKKEKAIEEDEEPGFELPPEVDNLPPELEGARLTFAQKKKDEKRRDRLMQLKGSAARLSNEEADLVQARIRVGHYNNECARLGDLAKATFKERGGVRVAEIRAELERAKQHLIDALVDSGQFATADWVLSNIVRSAAVRKERQPHIHRLIEAVKRSDDDHCCCPPEWKNIERRVWIPERSEFVDFIACPCGHLNATTSLPVEFTNLQRARSEYGSRQTPTPGATAGSDDLILNAAKRRLKS